MYEEEMDDISNRIESVMLKVEQNLEESKPEPGKKVGKLRRNLEAARTHLGIARELLNSV